MQQGMTGLTSLGQYRPVKVVYKGKNISWGQLFKKLVNGCWASPERGCLKRGSGSHVNPGYWKRSL